LPHDVVILERPRNAHPKLPVAKFPFEPNRQARFTRTAIFDRDRVHQTGGVRVASIGREDRCTHDQLAHGRGKGRDPTRHSLPGEGAFGERNRFSIHL
jgi:hypothetical protein